MNVRNIIPFVGKEGLGIPSDSICRASRIPRKLPPKPASSEGVCDRNQFEPVVLREHETENHRYERHTSQRDADSGDRAPSKLPM